MLDTRQSPSSRSTACELQESNACLSLKTSMTCITERLKNHKFCRKMKTHTVSLPIKIEWLSRLTSMRSMAMYTTCIVRMSKSHVLAYLSEVQLLHNLRLHSLQRPRKSLPMRMEAPKTSVLFPSVVNAAPQ